MIKVGFFTLGCKVNIYESNAIMNIFTDSGFNVISPSPECDVFVINTCSVTNMADAKSRKIIHKAINLNKNAVIAVMGCYSQTNKEVLSIEGVDIVIGNGNKKHIVDMVKNALEYKNKIVDVLDIMNVSTYEDLEVSIYDHTRAFIKIEDGCSNFCSYCIIPYARGPVRCKKSLDIINEMNKVTALGYKEIVLSGIHTGKYSDGIINLTKLIKMILSSVKGLEVLRLSSIEINEIDDELIELLKNEKILANHFHLPLQSGSDTILKLMNRKYDTLTFLDKVNKIRTARPDISLSTDVITGFPYETDELFNETYEFIKLIKFSKLHVFPYSKRSGTKAYDMPQINEIKKKERTNKLIELSNYLEDKYANLFINQEFEIIIENKNLNGFMSGHSTNFLNILIPYDNKLIKKKIKVKVEKVENGLIYGKIL